MSCFMKMDRTGNVLKSRISESVIKVNTRFSYEEVQRILDGHNEPKANKKIVSLLHKPDNAKRVRVA